ncbi:hypothetical protein SRHO_G00204470 [Serrasalmus rhombeus]
MGQVKLVVVASSGAEAKSPRSLAVWPSFSMTEAAGLGEAERASGQNGRSQDTTEDTGHSWWTSSGTYLGERLRPH